MSHKLGALKIIRQTNKVNTGTVICLHGSGDSGTGIYEWLKFLIGDFSYPHLKFIFPTAPSRPYTPLNGENSNVWFDRYDITPEVPEHKETLSSINAEVKKLIELELKAGVPINKIVIGGFSMGGALALHVAYRTMPGLAGVFAMSSFLNKDSCVYDVLRNNREMAVTPLCMYHGDMDTLVPMSWGRTTFETLQQLGVRGDFHVVKNTFHELKKQEVKDLFRWIDEILPESS